MLTQEAQRRRLLRRASIKISRWKVGAKKNPPRTNALVLGGFVVRIPAITDFRARGTIMGLAGLTAVFGMGTGVTPPVWSPEMYPAGGQAGRALDFRWLVAHRITNRVSE